MSKQLRQRSVLRSILSTLIGDSPPQRPPAADRAAWLAYWQAQNQPWRTEPEIDTKRRKLLAQRRTILPDIEKGIYPFRRMKLSRADVEWLLATHENGRGPVDWQDESQRERGGLDMRGADLRAVDLQSLPLARSRGGLNRSEWVGATLEQREMAQVHFERAKLSLAHLEGASLYRAHLEGAYLYETHLEGTSLRNAFFDPASVFQYAALGNEKIGIVLLSDVHWGNMNLSLVNWAQLTMLGDELEARQSKRWDGRTKNSNDRLRDYRRAVRAYRQVAVVLQEQGLNEDARRFAYHAQTLQRVVLRLQREFGHYLFSLFLELLAGYGYKPGRSFLAYLLVIIGFATSYYVLGHIVGPSLSPLGAFVFSMTSFHGRGFFPGGIVLDDPLTVLAAIEAFVGLIIEVTFIATLTQRFFGR